MDLVAFMEDQKTHDAVERCLERISEAAAKLGELAPALAPDQPWQKIRALGNRLRHNYDEAGGSAMGYRASQPSHVARRLRIGVSDGFAEAWTTRTAASSVMD
jgi:ribonuclease HepT-like protein